MRRALCLLVLFLIAASCGGGDAETTPDQAPPGEEPFAVVASSDLAVGENRFLLALREFDGTPIGSPSDPLQVTVHPDGRPEETQTVDASFVWIVPDVTGLYRAQLVFDASGVWMVEATLGGRAIPAASFLVRPEPLAAAVGQPAPASVTPTNADSSLKEITSDPSPDPRFYELSVDQALESGRPSVIVFATPAFCTTQACGPMVDQMKVLADSWPGVNWVHVEVFENIQDANNLSYVPAITEWGLPTEPWLFVADGGGILRARFEGVVDPAEIVAMLESL